MTDYRTGSNAILGARADLGEIASRYANEYGLGPASLRVALKAMGKKVVAGSGQVNFLAKTWYTTDDMTNDTGRREADGPLVPGQRGQQTTINVTIGEYGKYAEWDDLSPTVQAFRRQGGDALVEQRYTEKSTSFLLEALDYDLLTRLDAGSTPFTATDYSCSGVPWDGSTTNIAQQLALALLAYDGPADSILLSRKAAWLVKTKVPAEQGGSIFAGNSGTGILTDGMLSGFFSSFGISQVFVCDNAMPLKSKVIVFQRGNGNADVEPCAINWCTIPQAGEDAMGIQVTSWDEDPKHHRILASAQGDIAIVPGLGFRMTGTYTE